VLIIDGIETQNVWGRNRGAKRSVRLAAALPDLRMEDLRHVRDRHLVEVDDGLADLRERELFVVPALPAAARVLRAADYQHAEALLTAAPLKQERPMFDLSLFRQPAVGVSFATFAIGAGMFTMFL
jgi:hypothetical protein